MPDQIDDAPIRRRSDAEVQAYRDGYLAGLDAARRGVAKVRETFESFDALRP